MRHHRLCRQQARDAIPPRGAPPDGVPRVRLRGGRCHERRRRGHVSRRRQDCAPRERARCRARAWHVRHRPYTLGDARPADGAQCAPARQRRRHGGGGAQRHHRECQRPARRPAGQGLRVPQRHRHRSDGASRAGAVRGIARGGRHRRAAPDRRHVWTGHHQQPRPGQDCRRPQGKPAAHRHRRRRALPRVRRVGDSRPHAAGRLPRRRRRGGREGRRLSRARRRRRPDVAARRQHRLGPERHRTRRLRAFHAQGDLRAAADGGEHDARPPHRRGRHFETWRAEPDARPADGHRQHHHHRVRHVVALGADWRDDDRGTLPHPGGSRVRVGVPLPQPDCHRPDAVHRDFTVGRDGRHARGDARGQATRGAHAGARQRGGVHHRARGRRRHLPARRPRDRRRLHEGVHQSGRRAGAVHAEAGAQARPQRNARH